MLDQVLAWAVVILPTVFALGIEVVSKEIKEHPYWRIGVLAFGIGLSALTWFQISRATKAATVDRENAIVETSRRVSATVSESVSKSVTKSVSEQYQQTIDRLQGQIGTLQTQLAAQGQKVDVIGQSNIVTGKRPVKVELATPPPVPQPQIQGITVLSQTQLPSSPYPDAPFALRVALQPSTAMQPVVFGVVCDNDVLYADLKAGGENYTGLIQSSKGRLNLEDNKTPNQKSWAWKVDSPAFSPEVPWVVILYGKVQLHVIGGRIIH